MPLLPIDAAQNITIAVIGKLATFKNLGDKGSSMVRPPYAVTPYKGIEAAVEKKTRILFDPGKKIDQAIQNRPAG